MAEDNSADSNAVRTFVTGIGAVIVILMQVGFGMLQVGGVQSSKARYMVGMLSITFNVLMLTIGHENCI
jgi:hypothetical protein